jgi:hypothetical protein
MEVIGVDELAMIQLREAKRLRRRQIAEAVEHRRGQRPGPGRWHAIRHTLGVWLIRFGRVIDGDHGAIPASQPRG